MPSLEDALRFAHPSILARGIAVLFGDGDDHATDPLVVLIETRDARPTRELAEEVAAAVRWQLAADHERACATIVVGSAGLVLTSADGEIDRPACLAAFLARSFAPGAHVVADEASGLPPRDPRTADLTPSFRAAVATAARYLGAASKAGVEKRPTGVAARGRLHVLDTPGLPAHAFFAAGATFPVLLRHDNRTTADDAAPDARVAAIRVLDPARPTELDRSLLDLALLTGRCFFHRSAAEFFAFSIASPAARDAILLAEPHRTEAVWSGVRLGDSYRSFHYHSQTAGRFTAADGGAWFVRYRLRAPEQADDSGFVDSGGALYAPTGAARRADDLRSPSCLRDAFVADVREKGVTYTLQAQLVAAPEGAAAIDRALDCTRAWPEAEAPWQDLARLELDEVVPAEAIADLEINPANAPSDLGVLYARTERDSASIDHVRTILYEASARARLGRALSPGLRALLGARPAPAPAKAAKAATIAIVGAGASGLTLARALTKQGHAVTVFEKDAQVGGMCQTRTFDGVACELGGHMIYPATYPTIIELAKECGQALVPDFPDCTISLETAREIPRVATAETRAAKARVAELRLRSGALEPGLQSIDRALAVPIADWLAREGLGAIWDWMGPVFVGAGYGYLEDEVPATYLAKSFAHTVDAPGRYHLRDGFQTLWQRVAADLRDVRTACEVQAAIRDATGVTLTVRGPDGEISTARFDRLVIAHSPASALTWLDASEEERDLFGRVRHLRYASAIADVEAVPDALRARWCFVPENTRDAARRGHVTAFVQPDPSRPVVGIVAYAPPPGTEPSALFEEDFARLGAQMTKLHHYQEWSYFPHFGVDDLRAGAIDRLEALQGARHTWHASTLLAYELTECAAAYARAVALRLDRDVRGLGLVNDPSTSLPPRARRTNEARSPDADAFAAFRVALATEQDRVVAYIQRVVAEELEMSEPPDPDADLASLGVDSLRAASIQARIVQDSGLELFATLLAEAPDLRTLGAWLVAAVVAPEPPLEGEGDEGRGDPAAYGDDATQGLLEQLNEAG